MKTFKTLEVLASPERVILWSGGKALDVDTGLADELVLAACLNDAHRIIHALLCTVDARGVDLDASELDDFIELCAFCNDGGREFIGDNGIFYLLGVLRGICSDKGIDIMRYAFCWVINR